MFSGTEVLRSKCKAARRHSDTMVIGSPRQGRVKDRPRVDLPPPGGAMPLSADCAASNGSKHDRMPRYSVPAIVLSPPVEAGEDDPVFSPPPAMASKRKSVPASSNNNKNDRKHSSQQVCYFCRAILIKLNRFGNSKTCEVYALWVFVSLC